MTDISTLRSAISVALQRAGLLGGGSVWHFQGEDIHWVIRIDRPPQSKRLGIDIGLALDQEVEPREPTDCPILLHLENLPGASDLLISAALDMESGLRSALREEQLDKALRLLTEYLSEHRTISSIRAGYRAGDFRSAFIHKDARKALESP